MTVFLSALVESASVLAPGATGRLLLRGQVEAGAGDCLARWRVLGGVVSAVAVNHVCPSGPGAASDIPAAWAAVTLAAGYVAPMTAALDLVRGAAAVYDAASGNLTIGGRVLIGYAGKVFTFGAASSADYWLAINKQRAARELELMQGMVGADLAAFKARKNASLQTVAARVVKAAEKMSDGRRAALLVESGFCLNKWGA